MVTGEGKLLKISSKMVNFTEHLLNFGAIGIITTMTIQLVPYYDVHKSIYLNLQFSTLFSHSASILLSKDIDYLSLFTNFDSRSFNSVWVGSKSKKVEFYGLLETTQKVHPVPGMDSAPCVGGGRGPWNEKIYHFVPEMQPSSAGEELQSEYFVRFEQMEQTLEKLYEIREKFKDLIQICEVRVIKQDDIPRSPANGRLTAAFHFTWHKKP